jgi:hypothetical protein
VEVQYLVQVLGLEPRGVKPVLERIVASLKEGVTAPGTPQKKRPPHPRGAKRRRLRRKVERTRDQEWEQARQDAWLREMLSDTSGSEDEEGCGDLQSQGGGPLSCSRSHNTQQQPQEGSVPDRRRRIDPEVVVVRRWAF